MVPFIYILTTKYKQSVSVLEIEYIAFIFMLESIQKIISFFFEKTYSLSSWKIPVISSSKTVTCHKVIVARAQTQDKASRNPAAITLLRLARVARSAKEE